MCLLENMNVEIGRNGYPSNDLQCKHNPKFS